MYTQSPTYRMSEWLNFVTVWDTLQEELEAVGERIASLGMASAVKHGNNPEARAVQVSILG